MFRWLLALSFLLVACGGANYPQRESARAIFERVAPSVVAITNDDTADREEEARELEKSLGDDAKAPRHVVDVSQRKEPDPHGTGFMIDGGFIVTAAHVVLRPDRLKVTTRGGKTVDAELARIDEVRDIALLKPKVALPEVPPLAIEDSDVPVGEPLWAMGHTGRGYWNLSWGMSEGIASGVVEVAGARLLLFDVDLVVAQSADDDPLSLSGIRSAWVEKTLPRRVDFSFFARGSRGWSGRNVLITAYLVDAGGSVVGTSFGCLEGEIRPQHTWTCKGDSTRNAPLVPKAGSYDVVLALNGKPVAWWPMDAKEKKGAPTIQDMERWLDQVRKAPKK